LQNVQIGRDAVAAGLKDTLRQFQPELMENNVESLFVEGDTPIEQSLFAIRLAPRNGCQPSVFRGRTMVVCVRYKNSPTGWASIRELIQPATNDGETLMDSAQLRVAGWINVTSYDPKSQDETVGNPISQIQVPEEFTGAPAQAAFSW